MPIEYTEAYKEALASAPYDVITIDSIDISHSLFPTTLRIARCEHDITLGGYEYLGRQFSFKLPELSQKSNASLSVSIANISSLAIDYVDRAVETTEPILVKFNSWILGLSGPQAGIEQELEVNNVSVDGINLTLSASYPDIINLKLPRVNYTVEEFPGLR